MSRHPLQVVLDLRRREEDAAMARLADATRIRAATEEQQARRVVEVGLAQERLNQALRDADGAEPLAKAAVAATARAGFIERRRDELREARTALADFRRGPLAAARAQESSAREEHLSALRAREAFEKHAERHHATARATAQRREEEALEDTQHRGIGK